MFEDALAVDVVPAPSVEEFCERYVRRERPVIVRGAVGDWLPSSKWTPEHLKAMCGSSRVRGGVSPEGHHWEQADRTNGGVAPKIEFAKAIDNIFAPANTGQKCRVHQESLYNWDALEKESPPIRYVLGKIIAKNIWMGSAGNVTKTHYDMHDNINIQLRGRKEIILFPSAQLDELYPRRAWDYMSNFSRVEIAAPDLSRYPRFSRATPFRAILEPGDFIYIPIYWWHEFRTLEASLNVNFFWQLRPVQAFDRRGLRYWPRMARDRYLHRYITQQICWREHNMHR